MTLRLQRLLAVWMLGAMLAVLAGCTTPPRVWQGPDIAAVPWQRVATGLDYRVFSPWPDSRVHVLQLDLHEPSLRLEVSAPQARGLAMDQRPETAAAALASFNASFFDGNFVPRGITVGQGQVWAPVLAAEASPWLACDAWQRCRMRFEGTAGVPAGTANAVAGTPWLVRDGLVRTQADDATCAALCARTHPRTAVGLTGNGRWLLVVLVEGRRPPVAGVTLVQLSALMRTLGADEAINLDGGGSSTLWVQGRAVMARPANEPQERALSSTVSIVATGAGARTP